jgi:tRNA-modifying protein YgfZ
MARISPLKSYYDSIDAMSIPYGPDGSVVGQCDAVELEYAAIRKSVALMDGAHRGLLRLTGRDRLDFLHRLVTQDCKGMTPGEVQRAFVLDAKGRILADLLLIHGDTQTLIDTDVHQAAGVAQELKRLLFGEDVRIEDLSESFHRISLHGPAAGEVLGWWRDAAPPEALDSRYDETGEGAVHIWAPAGSLARFADRAESLAEVFKLRFIGWMAWNIARIEAGRPVFNVDFGPDNLPHEAGPEIVGEAVSFTKGCYRGQEIVARMHSRGHPARRIIGFRVEGQSLPVAGVPVLAGEAADAPVIGAVTSSTLSPMLGAVPIGFAMVKWGHHEVGQKVYIPAEGRNVPATVHAMRFYGGRVEGSPATT